MTAQVADISYFAKEAMRQFALDTQAVVHLIRHHQIWIDCIDAAKGRQSRSFSRRETRQVAVFHRRANREWRHPDGREDEIAFGPVIEHTKAAANSHLVPL